MTTITRRFEWDSAHRVLGHEGQCKFLHGHRYAAEVTVESPDLDDLGRVIDFGEVKQVIGKWILDNWDHNILLNPQDPLLKSVGDVFGGKAPFVFHNVLKPNPTAEVIAQHLFNVAAALLPQHIEVRKVRVYETPSCYADYSV